MGRGGRDRARRVVFRGGSASIQHDVRTLAGASGRVTPQHMVGCCTDNAFGVRYRSRDAVQMANFPFRRPPHSRPPAPALPRRATSPPPAPSAESAGAHPGPIAGPRSSSPSAVSVASTRPANSLPPPARRSRPHARRWRVAGTAPGTPAAACVSSCRPDNPPAAPTVSPRRRSRPVFPAASLHARYAAATRVPPRPLSHSADRPVPSALATA